MDKLLAMTVFSRVVEFGSFVRAADKMGLSTTAVSRHLNDLEEHLGTRLLQRTTRKLHLTEAGSQYHQRIQHILEDISDAESSLVQDNQQPTGCLRLSVSIPFSTRHLAPLIPRFCAMYPGLNVEILASDRKLDLIEDGLDLVLRISRELDGSLVARRLATIHTIISASPEYLARAGVPQTPADLVNHSCLVYTGVPEPMQWQFYCEEGELHMVNVKGALCADNGDILLAAAQQGMGITRQPSFMVGESIATGRLVPLLSEYRMPTLTLSALFPSRRFLPAKVRKMVDFLVAEWGGVVPPWDAWMMDLGHHGGWEPPPQK